MILKKISKKDLIFPLDSDMGRTCTEIKLLDYDWMCYIISTKFTTEELGEIKVIWKYLGSDVTEVKIINRKDNIPLVYIGRINSNLFERYITKLLTKHVKQWKKRYAFSGEDEVIEFFNKTIEQGTFIKDPYMGYIPEHLSFNIEG